MLIITHITHISYVSIRLLGEGISRKVRNMGNNRNKYNIQT